MLIEENLGHAVVLEQLLKDKKVSLQKDLGIMYPHFLNETIVQTRKKTDFSNVILHQFSVTSVDRFVELISEDMFEEDKELFDRLGLEERGNRIPRLDKYRGFTFCYNELVSILLHLKSEKNLDLDNTKIYLNTENYELLIKSMNLPETTKNLTIYDIPVFTDYHRETRYKCLSKLVAICDAKQEARVYQNSLQVTTNEETTLKIDSFRSVIPDLRPFKFFTFKV